MLWPFYILCDKSRFEIFIWTMMVKRGEYTYKNSVIFVILYWTIMNFKEFVTKFAFHSIFLSHRQTKIYILKKYDHWKAIKNFGF